MSIQPEGGASKTGLEDQPLEDFRACHVVERGGKLPDDVTDAPDVDGSGVKQQQAFGVFDVAGPRGDQL